MNAADATADSAATTQPAVRTLAVPGATLTYDIPRNGEGSEPPLLLIGSPMGASGFGTLAGHLADRTVITYDPRGVERSVKDDPASDSTPEEHADDLHRLIEALGGGRCWPDTTPTAPLRTEQNCRRSWTRS